MRKDRFKRGRGCSSQLNEVCEYNCCSIPLKFRFFVSILGSCKSGRVHKPHPMKSSAVIVEPRPGHSDGLSLLWCSCLRYAGVSKCFNIVVGLALRRNSGVIRKQF